MSLNCGVFVGCGRYQVLDKLGTGSFCTVYDSVCAGDQSKLVAIKVYEYDDVNIEKYRAEIRALSILGTESPHIMHLIEYFSHMTLGANHKVNLFMCSAVRKYKRSLDDVMAITPDGLSLDIIRPIFKQILQGIDYIHRNGIVHADLKPDNIMLNDIDGDFAKATVGIADFNHAIVVADGNAPKISGTQEYCSFEQILGLPFSYPTDVWSLGCIFYQMTTGRKLFTLDDAESSETTETESEPPAMTASTDSLDESTDHSDSERIADFKTSYDHCVCVYQLLGAPPKSIIDKSRQYFNRRGKPIFNPDMEIVDLAKVMHEKFNHPKNSARQITRLIHTMVKYLPLQRATPMNLITHSMLL